MSADEKRLLQRSGAVRAAVAHATRPTTGVSVQVPLRAAIDFSSFESDLLEFKHRAMEDMRRLLDFYICAGDLEQAGLPVDDQQLADPGLSVRTRWKTERNTSPGTKLVQAFAETTVCLKRFETKLEVLQSGVASLEKCSSPDLDLRLRQLTREVALLKSKTPPPERDLSFPVHTPHDANRSLL